MNEQDRAGTLAQIKSPLIFYGLSLLIIEGMLALLTAVADFSSDQKFTIMWVMVALFIFVLIIVTTMTIKWPENLSQTEEAITRQTEKAEEALRRVEINTKEINQNFESLKNEIIISVRKVLLDNSSKPVSVDPTPPLLLNDEIESAIINYLSIDGNSPSTWIALYEALEYDEEEIFANLSLLTKKRRIAMDYESIRLL